MPWSIIDAFDDPDDKVDAFNSLFIEVLDMHAPLKTVNVRVKKNLTPWINKTIRCEMDKHDRHNPSAACRDIFKCQQNRVVWLLCRVKNEYFN